MLPKRTEIRRKVSEILKGKTDAGGNVFASAVYPLDEDALPALLIYARHERSERWTDSPPQDKRKLDLVVQCFVMSEWDLDDKLDTLSEQVATLLNAYGALDGLVESMEYRECNFRYSDDGEIPAGSVEMQWEITYIADIEREDPSELVPFERSHVDYNMSGTIAAEDMIELPQ